jgi:hypothetical protein
MGQTEDPLLPSALRLARFYALLSPGILQQELGVDRVRAERLIESLVERGALGPVFVERSGARESLVNMVNERTGEVSLPPAVPIARASAGRRAVVATSLGIVLGLATCIALSLAGLGERFVGLLGVPLVSPALARVLALLAVPPAAGWGLGALAQKLLSPDEEAVPYGALRVRQGLWTLYAAGAIGFGAWQLFR